MLSESETEKKEGSMKMKVEKKECHTQSENWMGENQREKEGSVKMNMKKKEG